MNKKSFSLSASFPCSAEEVFTAFTQTRRIIMWSGQSGKIQSIIGGRFELFDGWVKGIVLAYEPGKRLSFTWKPAEWNKEAQTSLVKIRFTSTRIGSNLVLRHSGFPNISELQSHREGWQEFVFNPLKVYLTSVQHAKL
jgi:activator of HSP90 ATPase